MLDVIKDLAKQHTTMLIVTHEMKFKAKNVADEVVFMEGGHIVEMGLAHEVFEKSERRKNQTIPFQK